MKLLKVGIFSKLRKMLRLWFALVGVISIMITESAFGTGMRCSIVGSCLCRVSSVACIKLGALMNSLCECVRGKHIRMPGIPVKFV